MTATDRSLLLAELEELEAAAAEGLTSDTAAAQLIAAAEGLTSLVKAGKWLRYPWQHPHLHPAEHGSQLCDDRCLRYPVALLGVHEWWLQRGGRGTGKTEGAARYVNQHMMGPACDPRVPGGHRLTLVAPTQPDAVSSCVEGVSGLRTVNPLIKIATGREGTIVRWPNGSLGRVLGAHDGKDVDRARAWTNVCLWWMEEAAAQSHLDGMLEQAPFTLRLGSRPHGVMTTTPKNRPAMAAVIAGRPMPPGAPVIRKAVVQTWGKTEQADRLDPAIRKSYEDTYRGTTLGRQELDGELLDAVEGALWLAQPSDDPKDDRPVISTSRVPVGSVTWKSHNPDAPPMQGGMQAHRVVISLDQSGGGKDEAGLGVIGSIGGTAYVLADLSAVMSTDTWARKAVQAYYDYGAEAIVTEKYGGDQTAVIIRSVTLADGRSGSTVPVIFVPTKVGKRLRAEPVQAVHQQGRVKFVGIFPELEDQLTTWVPDATTDSPDRLDQFVHGVTYLVVRAPAAQVGTAAGLRIPRPQRRPG